MRTHTRLETFHLFTQERASEWSSLAIGCVKDKSPEVAWSESEIRQSQNTRRNGIVDEETALLNLTHDQIVKRLADAFIRVGGKVGRDCLLPLYSPKICLTFAIASIEGEKLGETWFAKPDIIARFTSEDERKTSASTVIIEVSLKSDLKKEAEKLNRIPLEFLGGSKTRVIVTEEGGAEGEVEGIPVIGFDHFFDEDFLEPLISGDTKSILKTIRKRSQAKHYR